jgi:hypothetical protein
MQHDQLAPKRLFMTGSALEPFTANTALILVIEPLYRHPETTAHQPYHIANLVGFFCHLSFPPEKLRALLSPFSPIFSTAGVACARIQSVFNLLQINRARFA